MDAKDVLEVQGGWEEGAACCQPQLGNGKCGVLCKAFQGDGKRGSEKKQPFVAFLFRMYKRDKCSIMCSEVLDEGDWL